jgi:hypothetical protein
MKKETLTVEKSKRGTITYRNAEGKLHNPDGPAVIWHDGYTAHYINGKRHNPHGPAVVRSNCYKSYWIHGKLHNPDGPAVIWHDGCIEHYINGKKLNEAEFKIWQAQQTAPLHNKTKVIDGIEYTLTAI